MAERIVIYWRDIPAQVIVREGRKTIKRELPERFIQAVDRCAMKVGARDSEAYLAHWRRGAPEPCGAGDLEAVAASIYEGLVREYDQSRLDVLVATEGWSRP